MAKSDIKAQEIIQRISSGEVVSSIKTSLCTNENEWYKWSSKAYNLNFEAGKKERKKDEARRHVIVTSNEDISGILALNDKLADYALVLSIFSTLADFRHVGELAVNLPTTEDKIIASLGKIMMHPKIRAIQKLGRIDKFPYFNLFTRIIDAATISYYRTNFISCYLTLLPVIEGIIIRWMGYTETGTKPEYEDIRKFFKNSHKRQPCPTNILFHNVYIKACDKILNEHFYRPTTAGDAYANFNRHVASHILTDGNFATRDNCIRLFILLDAMTEIYWMETKENDPRFELSSEEIAPQTEIFANLLLDSVIPNAEYTLLGTNLDDLIY